MKTSTENTELFNRLYSKYNQHLLKIAKRYSPFHNDDDASDMVNDTWEKIWKTIDRIDESSPFLKTYLTKIVMNTTMVWNKRLSNQIYFKKDNLDYAYINEKLDWEEQYNQDLLSKLSQNVENEAYKIFDENNEFYLQQEYDLLINNLPELDRKIFEAKISGEYTNQQIADNLGININKVYYILRVIKQDIKSLITN